jgi:glycosyltransferase involved in cell wall biosynthesis
MKLLSIITVNLNNSTGLERTIRSVQNQSWKNYEHIVIDGGSTDESITILKNNTNLIIWTSDKDNGIYDAMNKGILLASGKFLNFLNSGDVYYNSSVLNNIYNLLINDYIYYGDLLVINKGIFKLPFDKISLRFLNESSVPHPSSFIPKKLFLILGKYDPKFKIAADYDFWLRCYKHKINFIKLNSIISIFDENGLSSKKESNSIISEERKKAKFKNFSLIQILYMFIFSFLFRLNILKKKY